jgi:hypothetical protein
VADMISLAGSARSLAETALYQARWLQERFPRDEVQFDAEIAALEEHAELTKSPDCDPRGPKLTHSFPLPIPISYLLDDVKRDPFALLKVWTYRCFRTGN